MRKIKILKLAKFLLVFFSLIAWLFSGWPQVFNFPPEIQKAAAALNDSTIEVLGGGGGGGVVSGKAGGGGGGGEYRECIENLSVQSYTVTVGIGGTANDTGETDSSFSAETSISMTADGGNGTNSTVAGTAGTGGASTNCDTAVVNYDGGTPGLGVAQDFGGGGGGGAGHGGKGGNGAAATSVAGGGGGEGGSETAGGGDASGVTAGSGGGGGDGGNSTTADANGSPGSAGTSATYHIVGGGGGGGSGAPTDRVGGACGAPGAGSGGGEAAGAGNGCRGEVKIIYVDSEIDATGGTQSTYGIYRIHTFTTSGTFTVSSIAALPTVSTQAAKVTGATRAILNGTIVTTGSAAVTERGFAWGTSPTLANGNTATTSDTLGQPFGVGPFTETSLVFSCNTIYYSRAYATNSVGKGYGGISASFTTPTCFPTRIMRLFQGYRIKLVSGRLLVYGYSAPPLPDPCSASTVCGESCTFGGLTYGTVTVGSQCFMDRNLGATRAATSYNDYLAYGSLFQWGRAPDGHQLITCTGPLAANCSADNGTTATQATTPNPGHNQFILGAVNNYDWLADAYQNNNLWQSVSTYQNNPCPSGWHVPLQTEWDSAMITLGLKDCTSNCLVNLANSTLKLPAAGSRTGTTGAFDGQSASGYYWSSSPTSISAYYLYFDSTDVNLAYFVARANGFTVRCLKN